MSRFLKKTSDIVCTVTVPVLSLYKVEGNTNYLCSHSVSLNCNVPTEISIMTKEEKTFIIIIRL